MAQVDEYAAVEGQPYFGEIQIKFENPEHTKMGIGFDNKMVKATEIITALELMIVKWRSQLGLRD